MKEVNVLKIIAGSLFFYVFSMNVLASEFVHPLDFKGTDVEKEKVIEYIKKDVEDTYSAIGMDDPSTLRMMEKEELESFKQLTKAENRAILDMVIKTYCSIGLLAQLGRASDS
jgi:hypothetical protein